MGLITFNGVSSRDFHIQVEHPPEYGYPERDYTITHVPGRNGDLVRDNGSYKNIFVKYEIAVAAPNTDFQIMSNRVSEWLHKPIGYARLEDSYFPEHYRMAMYHEENSIENILNQAGRATIEFDCKPQRFLKQGERSVSIQNGGKIYNPTAYKAKPLITISGSSGSLRIGDITVTLNSIDEFVVLDCESENAYKNLTNCNGNITATYFPVLTAGENTVTWSGSITAVEIIPRWWTL